MGQERGLDPITVELLKSQLRAICDEMSFALERTCASQLIKIAQDFFTGLSDADGEFITISITQPNALGIIPAVVSNNTDIYQEGLRLSPLKLYDRGAPNETLWKLLQLNARYPDVLLADIHTQVTPLATGEVALQELAATYGIHSLRAYLRSLLDHGEAQPERVFRAAQPRPGPDAGRERGMYFGPQVGHVPVRAPSHADLSAVPLSGPFVLEKADSPVVVQRGWAV